MSSLLGVAIQGRIVWQRQYGIIAEALHNLIFMIKRVSHVISKQTLGPQYPKIHRIEYGHKEAASVFGSDPRAYAVMTKKFVGDSKGHVKEVHTIKVKLRFDKAGNKIREEIPGTERVWPTDLVLIAIGFRGPEQDLLEQIGVETTEKSTVAAEYNDYRTNVEVVFAAGDMRRGQSLIVWAITRDVEQQKNAIVI